MITEIKGDITKVKCDYICQQNNCIAVKPHGLSLTIAREMGVCPYSRRRADGKKNLAIEEDRPPLGRILTEKSPFKDVHVICMFAQYSYGTPQSQYYYSRDETYKTREEAFKKLRERITQITPIYCNQCDAEVFAPPFTTPRGADRLKFCSKECFDRHDI